ncbi:MAG: hypothetical protein J5784_05700 [Muribaculaceae bacterium]|nr:hypothetical protein [Muribaculaceae bacterium]
MKANINDIDALLAKYYDATATLEEEQTLRALLSDESLPERYAADKAVVLASSGESVDVPADLSAAIMSAVEREASAETEKKYSRRRFVAWISAAAAVALLAFFGIKYIANGNDDAPIDKPAIAINKDNPTVLPQEAAEPAEENIAAIESTSKPKMRKQVAGHHKQLLLTSAEDIDDSEEDMVEMAFAGPQATAEELIAYEQAELAMVKMTIILDRTFLRIGYSPE